MSNCSTPFRIDMFIDRAPVKKPHIRAPELPPLPKGYRPKHFLHSDDEEEADDADDDSNENESKVATRQYDSDNDTASDSSLSRTNTSPKKHTQDRGGKRTKKAVSASTENPQPITIFPPMSFRGYAAFNSTDPLPPFPKGLRSIWKTIDMPQRKQAASNVVIFAPSSVPGSPVHDENAYLSPTTLPKIPQIAEQSSIVEGDERSPPESSAAQPSLQQRYLDYTFSSPLSCGGSPLSEDSSTFNQPSPNIPELPSEQGVYFDVYIDC